MAKNPFSAIGAQPLPEGSPQPGQDSSGVFTADEVQENLTEEHFALRCGPLLELAWSAVHRLHEQGMSEGSGFGELWRVARGVHERLDAFCVQGRPVHNWTSMEHECSLVAVMGWELAVSQLDPEVHRELDILVRRWVRLSELVSDWQ